MGGKEEAVLEEEVAEREREEGESLRREATARATAGSSALVGRVTDCGGGGRAMELVSDDSNSIDTYYRTLRHVGSVRPASRSPSSTGIDRRSMRFVTA